MTDKIDNYIHCPDGDLITTFGLRVPRNIRDRMKMHRGFSWHRYLADQITTACDKLDATFNPAADPVCTPASFDDDLDDPAED